MGSNLNKRLFFLIIFSWLLSQGHASFLFLKQTERKSILAAEERANNYYITEIQNEDTEILGGNQREWTEKLLSQPRATLTLNETYEPCIHTFKNLSRCIDLEKILSSCDWNFVNTFGTCVRLFEERFCMGESVAIYPGSNYSFSIVNPYYTKAQSIGPCFEAEFDKASFYKTSRLGLIVRKDLSDPRTIPDLFNPKIDPFDYLSSTPFEYKWVSIFLTYEERLKLAHANIGPGDYPLPTFNITYLESSPEWSKMDKREGDRLGFAIPTKLAGPGKYTYNIFPQGSEHWRKWKEVTDAAVTFLERNARSAVNLNIVFDYYNGTESYRPWRTYYYVTYGISIQEKIIIKYNYILND